MPYPTEASATLTVSQLNRAAGQLLSEHFWSVWVAGEISNLSTPSSGHWYFSLKDAQAQVRCAMFKNSQRGVKVRPENGKQIRVKAQVSLYEPRGDYQLIVESLEPAGEGELQQAFAALKRKLADEGLFDARHKQALPALPSTVGVITSPSGAAVRDILSVLKRRFPAVAVLIYPVSVQGDNAQYELAQALATANADGRCDVLIVGRGGGSLEDLWAFNEERVARAIFASRLPVISAVGHETDFTIADFVADLRAPTPSAAAEHVVPDGQVWLAQFADTEQRLQQLMRRKIGQQQQRLAWLAQRLQQQQPGQRLARNAQRLDELDMRLNQVMAATLRGHRHWLEAKQARLWQHHPAAKIRQLGQRQQYLQQRLAQAMAHKLTGFRQRLAATSQTLHAVSPLATLSRGYALVSAAESGEIIRSSQQLKVGDKLAVRLGQGRVSSAVLSVED
ncbi:exodeoxyribonuclease VII large subunit [Methylovulum psychrotolerans]|uniref:exodeoxyribonuclease VII large subunit n=1 Tax=Methylovulum psychrotolerans TaxID=1704499 RepID=UPI001BFF41E5|nr:exodeoxyribonuclease VII large subunit [Methylovulum psychrotolerans]MBT9097620.1 exodeoxyribonuclease VII large subunit [Methylovulum psychrotolerans]